MNAGGVCGSDDGTLEFSRADSDTRRSRLGAGKKVFEPAQPFSEHLSGWLASFLRKIFPFRGLLLALEGLAS
jgi:hypothetical protein